MRSGRRPRLQAAQSAELVALDWMNARRASLTGAHVQATGSRPTGKTVGASKDNRLCRLGARPKTQIRPLMHAAGLLGEKLTRVRIAAEPHPDF